jgi:hypothetical protein
VPGSVLGEVVEAAAELLDRHKVPLVLGMRSAMPETGTSEPGLPRLIS